VLNKDGKIASVGDRLLLLIAAALLFVVAVGIILMAVNWSPAQDLGLQLANQLIYGHWEAAAVGFLIMLMGLRFIYLALSGRKAPRALISSSELGDVTITIAAVENMVQRTAFQVAGIREARPAVIVKPDGVAIKLRAWVDQEAHMPELATEIQELLSSQLKKAAGLTVTSVSVEIQGVGARTRERRGIA